MFEAGEQAYLADKRRQEAIDNLQLRADIDFLSVMAGVEGVMTVFEMAKMYYPHQWDIKRLDASGYR